MNKIIVEIDNKKFEVKKLAIKDYADLMKGLGKLPDNLSLISGKSNEEIVSELPMLIGTFLPEVLEILSGAVKVPGEELEEMGLDDIIKLTVAVYEVNNISGIVGTIKKMMARQNSQKKTETSTEQ